MRRVLTTALSLIAASAAALALATPASAKVIEHGAGHVDVTITDDEVCGVPVTTHIVGANPFQAKQIGQYVLFMNTGHVVFTFTGDDGRWVQYSFSGPSKDVSVTSLGDDLIVVHHLLAGIGLSLVASNGDTAIATGLSSFDQTFNDGGTPSNPDDDVFLGEVVKVSGANNDQDIDFCGFVEDHLS